MRHIRIPSYTGAFLLKNLPIESEPNPSYTCIQLGPLITGITVP